jgi:hypothetical protein
LIFFVLIIIDYLEELADIFVVQVLPNIDLIQHELKAISHLGFFAIIIVVASPLTFQRWTMEDLSNSNKQDTHFHGVVSRFELITILCRVIVPCNPLNLAVGTLTNILAQLVFIYFLLLGSLIDCVL